MKKLFISIISFFVLCCLVSCNNGNQETTTPSVFDKTKGNTAYQLLVYSFNDSDGDGVGDFNGIKDRLGYLKDLGISLIWLSPIHKANSYHGYNVVDYYSINNDYGTLDEFKELVTAAHEQGIAIILDMVLNHSSNTNKWFTESCQNKSNKRDWYVWKKDGVTYGTTGSYAGRFYSSNCNGSFFSSFNTSMPDFNLTNQEVIKEHKSILKYWLDLGVDGFRYDAIKHFFDATEYPSSFNRAKAIDTYMKSINGFVHSYKENSYIVGEYLEFDYRSLLAYAPYFDTEFDFGWYDRILDISVGSGLSNYVKDYNERIAAYENKNANWINSVIISNHDHDRIMSIVNNDSRRAKLALNLQMLLPGMPFVYYGDEVGLKGERYNNNDIERRLPFTWGDTWYRVNADNYGANLYRKSLNEDVESVVDQLADENSLLNYYKKVINFRNSHPEIYNGDLTQENLGNSSLISYSMTNGDSNSKVIHNTSYNEVNIDFNGDINDITLNKDLIRVENNKLYLPGYVSIVIQ